MGTASPLSICSEYTTEKPVLQSIIHKSFHFCLETHKLALYGKIAPMPPLSPIDLHMHTLYSDGRATPQELVEYAVSIGMQTIAITDHDNARGSRLARPLAEKLKLTLIPAIEMTCRWDAAQAAPGKSDIDVLGYFLDLDQPDLQVFEEALLNDFHERTDIACWYLSAEGYTISLQDVLRENPYYAGTRPLLMAVLQKGYASSYERALGLVDKIWRNVRPSSFTIDQVISAIRRAGGVPVLAHPTIVPWPRGWLDAEAIRLLVDMGLVGMEIYHPRLNEEARRYFYSLAAQFNLLVTGGSDDHGWPVGFPRMGNQAVTEEMVQGLQKQAERIRMH
jgi:predicted metal-dependent phosphoesterase TrpH